MYKHSKKKKNTKNTKALCTEKFLNAYLFTEPLLKSLAPQDPPQKKNKTQTPDLFFKEPQNLIPRLPNPFKSTPLSKISKYARIQF